MYRKCLLTRTKHTELPGGAGRNGTETVVARFSGIGWRTLVHLQHVRKATVSHDRAAYLAQANKTDAYVVKKGPAVNDRFMSFRNFVSQRNCEPRHCVCMTGKY